MKFLAFKIWYSDKTYEGKTYDDWVKAPDTDVQVVVFYLPEKDHRGFHSRVIYNGLSYYGMDSEGNIGSAVSDGVGVTEDHHVLTGKDIDFDLYKEVLESALRDFGHGWLVLIPEKPATVKDDWHLQYLIEGDK